MSSYILNIKQISSLFKIYFDQISDYGYAGSEPYISMELENVLKEIEKLKEDQKINNVEDWFKLSFVLNRATSVFEKVTESFKRHPLSIEKIGTTSSSGANITMSSINEMTNRLVDLSLAFSNWQLYMASFSGFAYENIYGEKIGEKIKDEKDIDELNAIYDGYIKKGNGNYVVELYITIIENVLQSIDASKKDLGRYINNHLEILRTNILQCDVKEGVNNRKYNSVQKLVQTYNLVPDGPSRDLKSILSELGVNVKSANIWKAISNKLGRSVLLIVKRIGNPIEHNLWTLSDRQYIKDHKLEYNSSIGINKIVMDRTRTIYRLEDGKEKDYIELFGDYDKCFILESLTDDMYRFLIPWDSDIKEIPTEMVKNLGDIDKTPSQRLTNYNNILNLELAKYIADPYIKLNDLSRNEIEHEKAFLENMKGKIKNQLTKKFMAIYEKTKKKTTEMFTDPSIYSTLISIINENLPDFDEKHADEISLSYFNDIDKLIRNVNRDIEPLLKEQGDINLDVKSKAQEIFELIIGEILDRYINRKSNIFLSIEKKTKLLTKIGVNES